MAKATKQTESAPNAPDLLAAAQWLPIADLKPNPRNPRMHGSEVTALARTILRTAWGAPIVAQARAQSLGGVVDLGGPHVGRSAVCVSLCHRAPTVPRGRAFPQVSAETRQAKSRPCAEGS